jgi:maleylacetate reductase
LPSENSFGDAFPVGFPKRALPYNRPKVRRMTPGSKLSFVYQASPVRAVFGIGALEKVPEEIARLGAERVLIVATPGRRKLANDLFARLGSKAAGIFDRAVMHVPSENAKEARGEAERLRADGYIAVGGGSATGVAKAIAVETGHPILCIPTTYSGSEMTPTWGLTEAGIKKTMRDAQAQPKTAIYDPALTVSMPAALSATSGMNAMAHCVEALYAQDGNPIVSLQAEEGIRALAASLPIVVKEPANMEARSQAFYGAWLGGMVLGATTMALHHKLCHILGGAFNLPHSETHTVLLPHVTAYNASGAPGAMERIARALGGKGSAKSAAAGLHDLEASMGAPLSLKSLGMKPEGLDRATEIALQTPFYNPTPVTKEGVRTLLEDAFEGRAPREWAA